MNIHYSIKTLYTLRYVFCAWPNSNETKLDFNISQQVSLLDYIPKINKLSDSRKLVTFDGFNYWAQTGFEIQLVRYFKKYLINDYIPAGLMVSVSWVRLRFPEFL